MRIAIFILCLAGFLGAISEVSALNVYQETEQVRKKEQSVKVLEIIDAKAKLLITNTPTETASSKQTATMTPTPTSTPTVSK
jgi:hypothetical protein